MNPKLRKFGWSLLVVGILMLLAGLILAMVSATRWSPVLLLISIFLNAIAITMLTYRQH